MDTHSVRVRLTTRDEDIKVDDSPIYVPTNLKRYGLSEVVNQLLQTVDPIPFDFLIDGQLLKGNLEQYLASQGKSAESIITLEYVRSILPPTFLAAFQHDDWVSAVHQRKDVISTGSFDGVVRIWDQSGNVTKALAGHSGTVNAVQWIDDRKLISASYDRNLMLWNIEKGEISCVFQGHTSSVNAVTAFGTHIVSGSSDNTLRLWSTKLKDLPAAHASETSKFSSSQKRRKLAEAAFKNSKVRGSLKTLEGHTAAVTGLAPHFTDADVCYSVSEDHSIRTWDLVTGSLVDTKTASHSLLSIATLKDTNLLACGSSARHIILVDPRTTMKTTQTLLYGHRNFVVSLSPSPDNAHQLASASHDGTVRIWDIRTNKSMYTLEQEQKTDNDLYCVDWAQNLAFGGKTKKLELFKPTK